MTDAKIMESRWRLILGQFAEEQLPLGEGFGEADEALSFLYDREYSGRGVRTDSGGQQGGRGGSVLTVPDWLHKVRKLFPKQTSEILCHDAMEKYGIEELLCDPEILRNIEPDITLLGKLLSFRSVIPENVKAQADEIIRRIAEEIRKKLENDVKKAICGKRASSSNSYYRVYKNFDFKRTVERNLKNFNHEVGTIIPRQIYFHDNVKRYNPWDIIILADQSGSMANSLIYSAVTASIFARLPFLTTHLAVFDTAVVDLSEHIDSAADILMKVQLGGGTDIFKALCYGEKLIKTPAKTIIILITDLYDGSDIRLTYRKCADLIGGGTKLFVLPALDYEGEPVYNRTAAKTLAKLGAQVGAVTPEGLSEWIGNILS